MQIEYAQKCIQNSETIIGVACKDGVILISEKIKNSILQSKHSDKRVFNIDEHIGFAICGKTVDGTIILEYAKWECESYRKNFGVPITGQILAERLSYIVHMHTLYGQFRPLGCEIFISSYDEGKFKLFKINNSGSYQGYFMCTGGKGSLVAKNVLESVDLSKSVKELLPHVCYAIAKAHEEFKDKTYEMEIGIIS